MGRNEVTAGKRRRRAQEALNCLKQAGHDSSSGLIVDVGCGLGYFAQYLLERGIESVGVDISKQTLKVAKEKIVPKGSFILADGTKLPFKDGSFFTVILNDVLANVPYSQAYSLLNEVKRITHLEGRVYLSVANRYQIREPHTLIPFLTWLPKPCWTPVCKAIRKHEYHAYPYTVRRLEKLCHIVGLDFENYMWFYAWNKVLNVNSVGDPMLKIIIHIINKLKLSKPVFIIAEKVSVILFICQHRDNNKFL